MGTSHKWAKEMIAFANGDKIQECLDELGCVWFDNDNPNFHSERAKFRIKPQTIKYRVALMKCANDSYTNTANDESDAIYVELLPHFSHWLTDWVEVEV